MYFSVSLRVGDSVLDQENIMIGTLNRVASACLNSIEMGGLRVVHSTDFETFEAIALQNKRIITPHFCPRQNTFFMAEAFWIGVWDGDNCVATIACKYQPLGAENLVSYSKRYWSRVYCDGSENDIEMSSKQKRYMKQVLGNLVYCGEFWVDTKHQKSGIGTDLAAYTKCIAAMYFGGFDFLYIYMEDKDVRRGLLAAIGFSVQIKNALAWVHSPSQAKPDYWLAGLPWSDFQDWLDDRQSL